MSRRAVLLVAAGLVAVLGVLLVFLYVQGADDRALADQKPVKVLVAKLKIPAGTTAAAAARAGAFETKLVPTSAIAPGALSDIAPIADKVALAPVFPGEQILAAQFGSPGTISKLDVPDDGRLAVSFQFSDPARVAGFIAPGSHVAVFLTTGGQTRMLLPDVEILATGATTVVPGKSGSASVPQAIVTFAVDQKQAQQMIYAQHSGELYLSLLGDGSKVTTIGPTTAQNLFD